MDNLARPDGVADFGDSLLRFIGQEGSYGVVEPMHKYLDNNQELPELRMAIKNIRPALIADIAHFMCIAHGRLPGVVDHAATKIVDDAAREWFVQATNAFASERAFLNRLTVAAGPITRQLGQDKITALVTNQVKNFQMIATSDRAGCAAGAAIAFVVDWNRTRMLLNASAINLGLEPGQCGLPDDGLCKALAKQLGHNDAKSRAMIFGADQLLGQQRGLWKIIAARHTAMLQSN
jgi:hypothetical protein